MKIGHIGLPVSNIAASKKFYDAIVGDLGMKLRTNEEDFVGYGDDSYRFYLHQGKPAVKGIHICFDVESREKVDAFYEHAVAAGGEDNGAPGVREDYSPTYYAAFVIDPDGNNIEAVYYGN